ncbi:hypothetical protein LAZ67_6002223, partial [Cordylochernes scorpioides]
MMAEELILRLKKKRAINRSYLTKTCNKIESGLNTLIRIDLEELLEQLNESFKELKLVVHEIETLLETDDLEKELQGIEEYREKYITWRFRANKKIRQSDFHGENIPNSNSRIDENEMRHYVPSCTTVKLPKLMISKFYGNFSEWLTFWNSFDAAIHQNNSLNPIDKFNYLKSHLGGTALNTVEGFALSVDNYEKAIKLLKDRFGREDILISRHMNNLLSMRPLKTSSDVRTFRELFDNLSVQIRSLESLNVSIDVYGQLLCPIIIKLLPADLNLELNKELPTGYVINDLITFLERQLTARERSFRNEIGTGNESTSKPNLVNKHSKTRFYNEKPIATASELLNSVHKSNECVFCGKDNHGSPKCDFAANMSLNEKRSLMRKKGVCYKCLRPSHLSKFCRNLVRCSICNMSSHLDVMCTKLILDRGGSSKSPTVQDETLANLSTSPDVLLPTLRVTLKGNRTEKTARAIIDTGSQRSYILHSTAMEMEYEQSRREFFRHSLFGGSSTDVVEHEVYTIHLSDINNSYRCEFEALGQPLICGSIPPVCPRSFLEGSEELDVSDLMRDRIEVLIGADIAGRLLTDDQRRISSGLVAIQNLWKLDAIGVSDAEVEKKTQSLQAEMEEHFAHTTTRDIEGRYEVALPWVQDKERIPSNKDLAENQLSSVRRKLEEVGDMNEYGQIFEEWMKQGIIEYAREDKLDGVHYLPHRPVYKRNSHTSRIRPVFNASARKRDEATEHLKITAEQFKSSFYVDNCLSSFQNVEETEKFVKESTELLSTACFNLRDWVSNVTDFSLMNQLNKEVNILGITWNTDKDTLTIGLEDFELIGPTTKRKVLSIASKIFNPLGVACPVTLIPKLILQETWIQKLTWDEVLPGCLVQRFWKWFSKLKHLPNIEIPRWLCFKDSYVEKTTLHIFCDASQFAYATCIFLRIEKEDRVDIQLIQARTRVAPLKKLTIPRLELLACLIGVRLAANVIQDLEFEEIPRFYWTDSTNALCWIQKGRQLGSLCDEPYHFLVSLLIRWNHETHGHAGLQTLLGILRENYWILRSRKTVKKIINQCIRCKRFTATPATVESTSLPEDRVRDAAVFEIVGVDLTGHLILKNKKKAWIVIFTCAVYRGVHLELVTSLSMEAFLQAFRRFIARRGRPLIVYSDNGTNFKGMANALKKIDFSRLKCDPTLKNITWKFIPPGAPWWGGWILGQTSLGYEELSTVMCDVESLMNTRPLTYLTEESEDLAPLTPSLFLHEVREVGVPDLDLIDNQTLSRKYQYIKRVREDLRERFRIEYFGFLRQETRRLKTTIPFKVGDMVLIGQESLKRLHWPLARIIQLYPGKDGLVRVAKVKTSSGDKIRPIQKLYNLEITPEIRCRDPLTERSPTQEVRLTTEEDPLTSQQEQHHIETPNVVSSYGRPIKRPNRLDLLNFSFPCLSRRDANSKIESGLNTLIRIDLEELLEQLNESFKELKLVVHEIETLLETDDLEKELQGIEEYREKYITWRFRANKKIRQSDFHGENIPNSNSRIDENEMRHYVPSCTTVKLPKLMISKFYGNFSEWLTFWNSFDAAIHQNNSLNPIDKFNYLKSHLGGTALNTVEGFALSVDNYEKAIKLLKDRFGREDILISRHMNNLLSMRPLKTSSDVRTFRELFDNLSVQIRSLESLNVSIDVYGQLLCPIIIKLLPADLNLELNKELPTGYVINDLITFLERQLTARERSFRNEIGTGNESTSKPNLVNKHSKTRFYNEKPIATASELLNSVHKSNECVFCGKDNHGSPKCDFAANMSLNEKRSLMRKKGVCYKCLRPSHLSKFCRNLVRCSICNMSSHLDVMCTKLILDRGGSSKSPTVQDETLANLSTSPDVLLPTLRVTLKGNRTEKTARAIIDTGSQRSYILHSTAMEMEYEQSRREFFRHSLFGGSSTDVVEHEVYTIHLSDINNSYRCEFEALGQPLICGSIPPVCPRSFLEGSEELDVSDLMRDRIEVLIGADIAGRLLTDDQRRISSGLVAIQNLWKLDAIGVSDAEVEKKTQSLQAEMEEHFAHTTTRDIEGRYEVALPWVQDKERIPSNKDLAENQLSSVRRKLEEVGDMNEYGQIFEEWMKQGIIEYAREDKLDGVHYLPHRPVYKRNSHTSRIRPVFNASARKRDEATEHLKITAEQFKSSFYVDNCLSSFQNVEETEKFVKESTELLSTACFNLRDWVSNVTDFSLMNQLNKEVNILGITWNTDKDTLTIGLEDFELIGPTTKRKVLSIASKIFNPLGVACPVTLIPKLILQETWIQKLTWDEVLPGCLVQRFWKWFSKLKHLPNIEIPRWLCFKDSYVEKTTLHIFCDASQFAYATCIFLRIEKEDRVDIQLIQARTRVAPLKKLTIPRLELLACLIGVRLAANVIQDLEFEEIPRFYWTDSTNALCWIQKGRQLGSLCDEPYHFLVSLLIRWNHETHGHAGLQTLLGILRENYWILRSRKTVKKIINQCIRCKRFTATPATVESTSLPEDRVRDAAVFEIVGVDLTGHLILKNKKKAWIVIFTCAVYRGVHLELVTSLSMEAFLQAFRRFIARRGRPLIVYSDNGTNFKGMANALKKIDFSRLKCDPTLKNITWKFIPPGAPWWGGWILGQTSLGYEELSTVMYDVESLMNTRPLTYLTEESEDLAPLTPSLFLHEVREVGVPDLDLIDNQTLSRKYQYIKRVREDLRERFRIEYFGFLRQETRRLKTTIPFKVGDMVLIGQESLKRLHWPLARIIQLYPGKDGLVRVAKVKTSSGDKIRPIQKLYNLEITPEIRCRDPLTERSPTQEVRLTTEEDPLTSQQEQHHIETPNVVSSYGRPIKRPNRLDLLNFSFPCLSRRDANSK